MRPHPTGRRRHLVVLTGGVAGLLLVAACSSATTNSVGSATTSSPATSSPTTNSPTTNSTALSTHPGTAAPTAGLTPVAACRAGPPAVSGQGPGDTAVAARSVADDYTKFFDPRLSDSAKAALLQGNPKQAAMVRQFTTNTDERMGSANVTAVRFTGPTTADVTLTLCLGGDVGLQDIKGQAVLENGTWKVADATLCRVLTENNNGDPVAACA